MFWTVAIPPSAVVWDLEQGIASYRLTDYPVPDWVTVANSLASGNSFPAIATFDLRWGPVKRRFKSDDKAQGWQGEFIETDGSISWHSTTPSLSFSFKSSKSDRQYQAFGAERNGAFYGKPSAFFASPPATGGAAAASQQVLPNTGRPPGSVPGISVAAGALAIGAAAAFLRRRERLIREATDLDRPA